LSLFILPIVLFLSSLVDSTPSDGQLQRAVDEAMHGHAGAIVVVDVASEKILAARNLEVASLHNEDGMLAPRAPNARADEPSEGA